MAQFTEDIVNSDVFKKQLKREVDMANKRLKGLTHIFHVFTKKNSDLKKSAGKADLKIK